MFCPNCGLERVSTETSFCSRCGFLLSGTAELLQTGGLITQTQSGYRPPSPRNRGLKQGLFIFLLTFLIVPLLAMATIFFRAQPFAVVFASILLVVGGLLRMAYALMFESPQLAGATLEENLITGSKTFINRPVNQALPPQQSYPVASYVEPATGNWRDTSDLEPDSVTVGTTKLLEREETPQ